MYYITLTIEGWVNVLDRRAYKDILVNNLRHCQEKEGLLLYAYVIMSNHMHNGSCEGRWSGSDGIIGSV